MCGFVFIHDQKIATLDFKKALNKIFHRGPDDVRVETLAKAHIGFSRLAIMDLTHSGDQPFIDQGVHVICNGEIYNYQAIKRDSSYAYKSESDCEVLVDLFLSQGMPKLLADIDGEYAFVIYDEGSDEVFAARDPMGIRPLFYGHTESGKICFASEVKALHEICETILPFPPGHYYERGEIKKFIDLGEVTEYQLDDLDEVYKNINKLLTQGVVKRLNSDAPVGFLLSGGLDSSLVCAIAQKHSQKPIRTFAIGMTGDAIDLKYAKEVADHIGSDHTEVIITKEDVLSSLRDVIYHLETFDITTVRASVGMYLVCKFIREKTDIKVLMTGEVSDEIFGYKYTDFAPSAAEFQKEAAKRVRELYIYDVLRADRCIAAHSLEARVPFSDTDFVKYVMSIDPAKKMNVYGQGKYLLRKAFEGDYLPQSILYREKAAFSDAVGHSLVDYLKEYAESLYTDSEYAATIQRYTHATPFTKESLLYRQIFEEFYPRRAKLIKDFWMPNKEWENCDVKDPSARVLPNYGASGA
ncbi:MAG: asparagine synthetase B [Halobacteriovoraceae bacterium]|nr:asparagine synthetase B [Halobacteriovoraceae bacterium]|tara:strand:- start:11460 stop:13034 length:1575 start_codon:yes stop_codon:yes gene_type:complete